MAVGKEIQSELNRTFFLLGKLQDQIDVLTTNVITLGSRVSASNELDKTSAQEFHSTEQTEKVEKKKNVDLEEKKGGAVALQMQKVSCSLRPDMAATRRSKYLKKEAWPELENERWRDPNFRWSARPTQARDFPGRETLAISALKGGFWGEKTLR